MDQVKEVEHQLEERLTEQNTDSTEDRFFKERFEDRVDERPDEHRQERPTDDGLDNQLEQSSSPASDLSSSPVTVDIYDQAYHLRGQDPAYITQLALIVDGKMRAVAAGGTTVDSLRVAVLAALNIADQLVRTEAQYRALSGSINETESSLRHRAENLSGLLDSILTDDRKVG
jgi:cell division protein ZapA